MNPVTLQELRDLGKEVLTKCGAQALRDELFVFNVRSIHQLDPSGYAQFRTALNRLLFPPMNTNIQSDIAAARAKLDAASAELRALEERAKQEANKPWEPKGRDFILTVMGEVRNHTRGMATEDCRRAGGLYPTQQAAESALPYVTFFKRLCCLAQELNPSGKVGGRYYVSRNADRTEWHARVWNGKTPHVVGLFETYDVAERAAAIMSRDNWSLPSL